jgi:hypothetical protein
MYQETEMMDKRIYGRTEGGERGDQGEIGGRGRGRKRGKK